MRRRAGLGQDDSSDSGVWGAIEGAAADYFQAQDLPAAYGAVAGDAAGTAAGAASGLAQGIGGGLSQGVPWWVWAGGLAIVGLLLTQGHKHGLASA